MARDLSASRSGRAAGARRTSARSGKGWPQAIIFLAPALGLYSLFLIYPLATAVSYSFFEWQGTARGSFVGLGNYAELFGSSEFADAFAAAFWHNALIFVGNLGVQLTVGLGCAVLLMHRRRFRRFFQTAIAVPYLVNPLAIGFLFNLIFSPQLGPLNNLLRDSGLGDWAQPWLGQQATILPIVVLVGAWQWVGFPVLIFSAALASIPPEYEESARLDGASPWRLFRSITLPLLTPAIGAVTVLAFVTSFTTFALVIGLTDLRGGLGGAADTLMLIFYRTAFGPGVNAVGTSSAIAVLIFVLVLGVAVVFNTIMRRREEALT